MDQEQGFHLALDTNPADWTTRMIYSDWLEEHGRDDEAFLQRWLAKRKCCPVNGARGLLMSYHWLCGKDIALIRAGRSLVAPRFRNIAPLPIHVFRAIPCGPLGPAFISDPGPSPDMTPLTRREVEESLLLALPAIKKYERARERARARYRQKQAELDQLLWQQAGWRRSPQRKVQ